MGLDLPAGLGLLGLLVLPEDLVDPVDPVDLRDPLCLNLMWAWDTGADNKENRVWVDTVVVDMVGMVDNTDSRTF